MANLPTLRTFDASQPVAAYYAGKDQQRAQKLQDYQMQQQQKADARAEDQYNYEKSLRAGKMQDLERTRRMAQDQELMDVAKRGYLALDPDSPNYNEDVHKVVEDFRSEAKRRGIGDADIEPFIRQVFHSGALSAESVRMLQEKAGVRRPKEKGMTEYQRKSLGLQERRLDKEKTPAPTNLKKLIDERDALPPGDPRRDIYNKEIDKLTAVTGSTEFDPAVVDKVRARDLKKTRTAITNASDLSSRLRGLLTDDQGNPDSTVLGLAGKTKQLAQGVKEQVNATRKAFIEFAGTYGDSEIATNFFNPNIGNAELVTNMLLYANAKANDPQGRVARDDFENEKRALGANGILANAPDVLSRLGVLDQIHTKRLADIESELNPKGNGTANSPSSNADLPTLTVEQARSPDIKSGTKFIGTDGLVRVKK